MRLAEGWKAAACAPDAHDGPDRLDGLDWIPARVPGTAAAALMAAGRWRPGEPIDLDAEDWWFRLRFDAAPAREGERAMLRLGGIATHADVFLNGERLLRSESMFESHAVDVGDRLREGGNELAIRCLALGPMLEQPRKPRARWRTKLVSNALRLHRTMLLGRAPGIAPGPQAVGPWRPVELVRERGAGVDAIRRGTALEGDAGAVSFSASLWEAAPGLVEAAELVLSGPSGEHGATLGLERSEDGLEASGSLRVPDVARWWPHTHGEPALHELRLRLRVEGEERIVDAGRVGFRELAPGPEAGRDIESEGLDLHVNGVEVFARGAVWTPADPVRLAAGPDALRETLERVRDAGMNIVRVVGTATYENPEFHDLCDELGILVWQDFMFANLDYPIADGGFRAAVEREAAQALAEIAWRPSLAVLCGNSEVEQQVGMLGLDPVLGRGELFGELLPRLVEESGADAPYLPSSPCGGELPFRNRAGIAHYFGVGGFRRPLPDARRAGIRFAAECLAIANLADDAGIEAPAPADAGADWDFGDVRDHYLGEVFGVDAEQLRGTDPERYLELSRAVSGAVMAAVFGEWRRPASTCRGGIVLWLRDLAPGAGWGLLDSRGRPKAALRILSRALAPRAVWMTDEGMDGVDVHVANDSGEPFAGSLRISLYRDLEHDAGGAVEELSLGPHEALSCSVEGLLGRFVDASWAYRFGPPQQDVIVAALETHEGSVVSQAAFFPAGPPIEPQSAVELGLEAQARRLGDGGISLSVETRRFVYGLQARAAGHRADDDWLSLEPGSARQIALLPEADGVPEVDAVTLGAINLTEPFSVPLDN